MNVNITQAPNKWNLLWFLHFKMWYIKFLACLIDWKDVLSIQTHLNFSFEIAMFVHRKTKKKKGRRQRNTKKNQQQPLRNADTQAGRILWIFSIFLFFASRGMYRKMLELPFVKDHLFPLKRFVNYLFALILFCGSRIFFLLSFCFGLVICNWWWASLYAT